MRSLIFIALLFDATAARSAEIIPSGIGNVEEAMFTDYLFYQGICDEHLPGLTAETGCALRDLMGFYLNWAGWCTVPHVFYDVGWFPCADRSFRFSRPGVQE
ncbi:hypothetical protein [Roseovarius indicus]|uniref:hypothetical protein n=1 Tax=Roseovarius indicus TaxID=540747 RepID=UPI001160D729|nr:hypothetical protein [Roseovarius indicus]